MGTTKRGRLISADQVEPFGSSPVWLPKQGELGHWEERVSIRWRKWVGPVESGEDLWGIALALKLRTRQGSLKPCRC